MCNQRLGSVQDISYVAIIYVYIIMKSILGLSMKEFEFFRVVIEK